MTGKSIQIEISPCGTTKIEAIGYQGNECEQATEQIELILGDAQASKEYKPEYFDTTGVDNLQGRTL